MAELFTLGRVRLAHSLSNGGVLAGQPKRLVLLAYLVLARPRGPRRRDSLLALFWPELSTEHARRALRQALHYLRRAVGEDTLVTSGDEVGIAEGALYCDAAEFERLLDAGDPAAALALYEGDFLDGLHVPEVAPEFEEWVTRTRAQLRGRAAEGARQAAEHAERAGNSGEAVRWARRACELAPDDEAAWRELIALLDRAGDRAGALRAYEELAAWLAREFDSLPAAASVQLAEEIRFRRVTLPRLTDASASPEKNGEAGPAPDRADDTGEVLETTSPEEVSGAPRRGWRRLTKKAVYGVAIAGSAAVFAILGTKLVARVFASPTPAGPPVLAITPLATPAADSTDAWLGVGVQQMLAGALAREAEIDVVDAGRVREAAASLQRAPSGSDADPAAIAVSAAAAVGATLVADGSIVRGGGLHVLDMAVRAVPSGHTVARFTARGRDLLDVVDEGVARLLTAANAVSPGPRLESLETRSVEAYRAYVEGLRASYDARAVDAAVAFDAAIAADSSFISALVARRRLLGPGPEAADSARRLDAAIARVRPTAPPFDRMELDVELAMRAGDHARAAALARALVARFPRDPRAHAMLARILDWQGDFTGAIRSVKQLVALESLAREAGAACEECSGHLLLAGLYTIVGDHASAEAIQRRAVALHPDRPNLWKGLSTVLALSGRHDAALAAARRAAQLAPSVAQYTETPARRLIEARRYDEADAEIRRLMVDTAADFRGATVDLTVTVLFERGRFAEAARVVEEARRRDVPGIRYMYLLQAQALARTGDVAAATALYAEEAAGPKDSNAVLPPEGPRQFAWSKALDADARFLARQVDITALRALADSIEVIGGRSYYARDWRLHHHVRGLVAATLQQWAEAERHFQAARWVPSGWTRTNVELARVLLAQKRPAEAVQVLREAYAGLLDGMGRYAPRSELDFWMAQALAAAGQRDSARVYAGYVRRAWANADPAVRRRLVDLPY